MNRVLPAPGEVGVKCLGGRHRGGAAYLCLDKWGGIHQTGQEENKCRQRKEGVQDGKGCSRTLSRGKQEEEAGASLRRLAGVGPTGPCTMRNLSAPGPWFLFRGKHWTRGISWVILCYSWWVPDHTWVYVDSMTQDVGCPRTMWLEDWGFEPADP